MHDLRQWIHSIGPSPHLRPDAGGEHHHQSKHLKLEKIAENVTEHIKIYILKCTSIKTRIGLNKCAGCLQLSLAILWIANDPKFLHADSKDSGETALMCRLI